jgi:hypothetical protein
MLNDVQPPPMETSKSTGTVYVTLNPPKNVSDVPVPPPEKTVADVTLHDRPALNPTGAGNFWGLAIIGMITLGFVVAVAMLFWVVRSSAG